MRGRGDQKIILRTIKSECRGLRRSVGATQSLFGIVQGGGLYADLRKESAERLVEMDLPGYAIGGAGGGGTARGNPRGMIARTLEFLPKDKPRYVMGVGYPDEIEEYAKDGCGHDGLRAADACRTAWSAVHVRGADSILRSSSTPRIQGPIDATCTCMVCQRYSRAYLRHLFASGEPLAGDIEFSA